MASVPPPPRRRYAARSKRGRTTDAQERVELVLPLIVGVGIGGLFGVRVGIGFLLGALLGAVVVHALVRFILGGAVKLISGGALSPSGSSTPHRGDYSLPETLAKRGQYREAIDAYEAVLAENPSDPEPYVRIGRIYRDNLGEYEHAAEWFTRVLREAKADDGIQLVALQEAADLYLKQLGAPRKALPILSQIADRFPHTPTGDAARKELTELRGMLASEDEAGPLTDQYRKRGR